MQRCSGTSLLRLCAPLLLLLLLIGCGSNSGGSPPPPPPNPGQFTHVYAIFPPQSGINNTHFMNTVMNQPAIEGVTVHNVWSAVEKATPGPATCSPVGTDV